MFKKMHVSSRMSELDHKNSNSVRVLASSRDTIVH